MAANRRILNPIGHDADQTIIPTYYLAPVLAKAIEEVGASLGHDRDEQDSRGSGAIEIIAARAAPLLGVKVESVPRRTWGIVSEEFRNTSAIHADAILLAADVKYEELDLPEFPAGIVAAREMVDAHFEFASDEEPDPATRRELARLLLRFTLGFCNGDRIEEMIEKLEERKAEEEEAALAEAVAA